MGDAVERVLERWGIQAGDLELGEVIGAGTFGVIRAGTLREGDNRLKVAVKQMPMMNPSADEWQKVLQEAVVFAKASEQCRSTCRLYGICVREGYFCLVMKRYVTSLDKRLNEYPDRKAPQALVRQWMLDICQTLAELHAQNIILRDLKPANILLDEFDNTILADFGIARVVQSTVGQLSTRAVGGTYAYMAPESLHRKLGAITTKVDVWALGCLLLELETGIVPWEGLEGAELIAEVCMLKRHPTIPSRLSREFTDVLESCFVFESNKRMTALDVWKAVRGITQRASEEQSMDSQERRYRCLGSMNLTIDDMCTTSTGMTRLTTGTSYSHLSSSTPPFVPSRNVDAYSSFVTMEPISILGMPGAEKLKSPRAIVVGDGNVYVICGNSSLISFSVAKVSVCPSNKGIEYLQDCPQGKYAVQGELYWSYSNKKYSVIGPNDMLFIVAFSLSSSSGSLKKVGACVLVWKRKQFFCVLTNPRGGSTHDYTHLAVSPSGTLYCGCKDGTIEVWKPHIDTNQAHVLETTLTGQDGWIGGLALDKNDTLYSVNVAYTESIVRVWCGLTQVAALNLHHDGHTQNLYVPHMEMACTLEGKLYIQDGYRGSVMYGDLSEIVSHADKLIQGVGINGSVTVKLGSEMLSTLFGGVNASEISYPLCYFVRHASEIMYIMKLKPPSTNLIQAWRGNECIAEVDTEHRFFNDHMLDVDKDGTLYALDEDGKIQR